MREAIHTIAASKEVERIGVWLETELVSDPAMHGQFRGLVWDRHMAETPLPWRQLSPEPPLPLEILTATGSVDLDPETSSSRTMVGPLLELRRALWVPVRTQQRLRGFVLVGAKRKAAQISPALVEQVAAELAIALERDEALQKARNSAADMKLTRQILRWLGSGVSPETTLQRLVESCVTDPGACMASGAIYAAIGVFTSTQDSAAAVSPSSSAQFVWTAGDSTATNVLHSGRMLEAWRGAVESRRVVGFEMRGIPSQAWPGRVVAIPLESKGRLLGVLLAVLPGSSATLETLERLELRASLAAEALAHKLDGDQRTQFLVTLRSATKASSQPVLLLDAQGMVLEFSEAARKLLIGPNGQAPSSPTRATSRSFASLFRVSEQERVTNWLQQQMLALRAPERVFAPEILEGELENGERVQAHPPLPGSDASLFLRIERVNACESALASDSAETELQNVIEWLEEGVVLFDAEDRVRAINMRFEQMVGLTAKESGSYRTLPALIQRLENHAVNPLAFAERWRSLSLSLEGGVREELQMAQPIPRVLERSARPILDSVGRLLGRVEIYRDLTSQRAFQSKLLQTEKLAALGQMLTGVAHELSNPLTTILGYAQRLLTSKNSAGPSDEAQQIYQEAERASRILRQLLSHARETPPERRNLSLNQVVLRAMELQRFGLAAERIRVELDLDPALPMVRGDAGQLQQVLMNLVGNARQAIEQQGSPGTIRVRTYHEAEDRATLAVEDTGPGIPPAILSRVFDPFFTTKPAGIGTGLGLSIVLGIVREHGGAIRVTSPPSGGACFTVELPAVTPPILASQDAEERGPRKESRLPSAERAASSAGAVSLQRILVVEDEPTVARLIADVLEEEGYEVTVLLNGREALERAACESFDLIICDMKMPGIDGQRFYKSLKRAGSPLAARLLFVTGDTIGPHTQAFLTQHRLPYLPKPFRVEELSEYVRRALNDSHSASRPVAAQKTVAKSG